jgi:hypothetical protein
MRNAILAGFLLSILIFAGCSDNSVSSGGVPFVGEWEEHYTITMSGMFYPGPDIVEVAMTSRITFDQGTYHIATYRGMYGQLQAADYSGRYVTYADTIAILTINGHDTTHAFLFHYRFYGDSLRLEEVPIISEEGYIGHSIVSLPWSVGYESRFVRGFKNSGTFARIY